MSAAFETAFVREHDFGVIAGVRLPGGREPVAADVLARLHPDESQVARALTGYRQAEWTGGRLAWHAAAERLGIARAPLLSGAAREPLAPAGISASVTHKRDLAIVLVADAARGTVGIDLEGSSSTTDIAGRVLRPEEQDAVAALPEPERTAAVLLRFCVKEATYKAIYPLLLRYVGYAEARVDVASDGAVAVTLVPGDGVEPPRLEVRCERIGDRTLSAVRCLPR